jgi:capsular polysaccharide transport system ATP-binding protein
MIVVQNVTKDYHTATGTIRAVDNVSLSIAKGRRLGVLGVNGSGKSTLIRLIGRVELPTSGKITRSMSVSWPLAFRGGFHKYHSAYDNLKFLARIYDRPYEPMKAYLEEFTELGERLNDPIETYSSGMLAKVSFGTSLAFEFDCYLVDEVVAVGDMAFRRKCRIELFEKRRDRALLIASHQARTIEQSCDDAILIEDGRLVDTFDIHADKNWRRHLAVA